MKEVKVGMKFRFRSRYSKDYYDGYVDHIISNMISVDGDYVHFYATNGVSYKSNEVEWVEEIRDQQLKKLGL
jgi:hypothetical protein